MTFELAMLIATMIGFVLTVRSILDKRKLEKQFLNAAQHSMFGAVVIQNINEAIDSGADNETLKLMIKVYMEKTDEFCPKLNSVVREINVKADQFAKEMGL